MKKKCEKSSQDLAQMTPTLIEQMLYLGIPFANQSSICLLCCYVFNTKQVSCRNIISSSGLPKAFFSYENWKLTQITFSLHWLAAGADFEL